VSVLERLRKQSAPQGKKLFTIVTGQRLSGKTTVAGTLPGRTLMLQAAVLESGSDSAKELAERNGYELEVVNFANADDLLAVLKELETDTAYDHVFVDGLSAITEQKYRDPQVKKLIKNDNWSAFREIGGTADDVILQLKALTYPEKVKKPKATFLTCALKVKLDKAGTVVDVELECKGNMAVSSVTKLGEAVVTVIPPTTTESGVTPHKLITKSQDFWPGRIDGLLADQNPGEIVPADLGKLLALRGA
jgi:hypothetical protein